MPRRLLLCPSATAAQLARHTNGLLDLKHGLFQVRSIRVPLRVLRRVLSGFYTNSISWDLGTLYAPFCVNEKAPQFIPPVALFFSAKNQNPRIGPTYFSTLFLWVPKYSTTFGILCPKGPMLSIKPIKDSHKRTMMTRRLRVEHHGRTLTILKGTLPKCPAFRPSAV